MWEEIGPVVPTTPHAPLWARLRPGERTPATIVLGDRGPVSPSLTQAHG